MRSLTGITALLTACVPALPPPAPPVAPVEPVAVASSRAPRPRLTLAAPPPYRSPGLADPLWPSGLPTPAPGDAAIAPDTRLSLQLTVLGGGSPAALVREGPGATRVVRLGDRLGPEGGVVTGIARDRLTVTDPPPIARTWSLRLAASEGR